MGKSLEQVEQKATGANDRIDQVGQRFADLDARIKGFEEIDARMKQLLDTVRQAQQSVEKITGPGSELQTHREAVQQLSSQALQTQASIETLKKDRAAMEDFRGELKQTQDEIRQSIGQAGSLKSDLGQVRALASALTQDYARIKEASREAREDSTAAMKTIKEVDKKLGSLAPLQELTKSTEERLAALNALSEHVSHKTKALESQKHTIERAVVEANRLNEIVWAMDVQIQKLTEGHKQIGRTEEMLDRIEKLAQATTGQLHPATKTKDEFTGEIGRLQKDSASLAASIGTHVERLSVEKKEFKVFDQRLRSLQTAVGDAEARMEALGAKDKTVGQLNQRVDTLAKRFEELFARSDELSKKQATLESLNERLMQVDEIAKRTTSAPSSGAAVKEELLGETDEKLALMKTRKKLVDEVESKSKMIVNLLDDVRVNLEALGEQKALVDHVTEKTAKADFVLQEAQNTLRSLHQDRELAERMERSIRQLRARTERAGETKKTA
jgi:chromosome segregation ATPase